MRKKMLGCFFIIYVCSVKVKMEIIMSGFFWKGKQNKTTIKYGYG